MDLRRTITKLFSAHVLIAGLEFAAIAGFTQLLGTGAVGSFFIFQTIIGLIGIPGDLGVSKAVEKSLSADEPSGNVVSSSILLKMVLLAPWVVLLGILHGHVDAYVGLSGITALVAGGLVFNQLRRLSLRILAGQMQVGLTAPLRTLGKLTWTVVGFVSIYLGHGAAAIILAFVLGDVVIVLVAIFRLDVRPTRPTIDRMRSLITFGRYVFVGSIGSYAYSWMDVAILRFFVSPSVIGAYEIAWRVAALSMMLTNAVRESLFPEISRLYSEGNTDEISDILHRWIQPPLFVTIPAFFGAIVLGGDVLTILFSPEAAIAYPVLLIFTAEKVFRSLHMILGPALFAIDQPELGYRGSIVAIAVNLSLNILLIPVFGIYGAAVATTVSAVASFAVNLRYLSRFVPIAIPWSRVGWALGSSAIMGFSVTLLSRYYPSGIIGLFLGVGSGVGIFLLLVLANGDVKADIKSTLLEAR